MVCRWVFVWSCFLFLIISSPGFLVPLPLESKLLFHITHCFVLCPQSLRERVMKVVCLFEAYLFIYLFIQNVAWMASNLVSNSFWSSLLIFWDRAVCISLHSAFPSFYQSGLLNFKLLQTVPYSPSKAVPKVSGPHSFTTAVSPLSVLIFLAIVTKYWTKPVKEGKAYFG